MLFWFDGLVVINWGGCCVLWDGCCGLMVGLLVCVVGMVICVLSICWGEVGLKSLMVKGFDCNFVLMVSLWVWVGVG